jgi:hypothetical protein
MICRSPRKWRFICLRCNAMSDTLRTQSYVMLSQQTKTQFLGPSSILRIAIAVVDMYQSKFDCRITFCCTLQNFWDVSCQSTQLKAGSEKIVFWLCRFSILLGFIMSKNLSGLWFYLLIKVQNATSLVCYDQHSTYTYMLNVDHNK